MRKKRVCGNRIISTLFLCALLLLGNVPNFESPTIELSENSVGKSNPATEKIHVTCANILIEKPDVQIKKTEERAVSVVKQPLTLNSIAAGFNAYANNKIESRRNIHEPSITEHRFLEKIVSCLQTSFLINKQKIVSYLYSEKSIDIFLELNRGGFLKGIIVSKTSGDRFFDDFMKNLIEEGVKSFPPIPQLIEKVPYRLVLRISFEYGISLQLLLPR